MSTGIRVLLFFKLKITGLNSKKPCYLNWSDFSMNLLNNSKVLSLTTCIIWGATHTVSASDMFGDTASQLIGPEDYYSVNAKVADLNNDGYMDVASIGANSGKILLNDGTGTLIDNSNTFSNKSNLAIALGDLDGDNDIDAFVITDANNGPVEGNVWLNNGSGVFSAGQVIVDPLNSAIGEGDVALGDLDGDGDLDVFIANAAPNQTYNGIGNTVLLNNGSGSFTDTGQVLGVGSSVAVSLADLDGDNDIDAFVSNQIAANEGGTNKIWLNNGSGTFSDSGQNYEFVEATAKTLKAEDNELADLDGDGDIDAIALSRSSSGEILVLLNNGTGTFTPTGQSFAGVEELALADFDNDGDIDIFTAGDNQAPGQVWLNNGAGQFLAGDSLLGPTPAYTYGVDVGDFNNDGLADIFISDIFRVDQVWLNQFVSSCVAAEFVNNTIEFDFISVELHDPLQNNSTNYFAVFEGGNMQFLQISNFGSVTYQLSGAPTFKEVINSSGTANCHPIFNETDESIYIPVIEVFNGFTTDCYEAYFEKQVSGDYVTPTGYPALLPSCP